MFKKNICILTVFTLLAYLCPINIFAYNEEFDYVLDENNNAIITGLKNEITKSIDLNIPSEIDGYKVVAIGECAFSENYWPGFRSLTFPDTLEVIGDEAFYGTTITGNTEINIPASLIKIGTYAFSYMYGVTSFRVNPSNPKYRSYNSALFSKELDVLWNYPIGKENDTYILPAETHFLYCTSFGNAKNLKHLIVQNPNISRMGFTFYGCDLKLYGENNLHLDDLTEIKLYGKVEYVSSVPRKPEQYPVEGISLDSQSIDMSVGEKHKLSVIYIPANASNKDTIWESSNPDIVYVDEKGNIEAITYGKATIIALSTDGQYKDECTVRVFSDEAVKDVRADIENGLVSKNTYISLQTDTKDAEIYYTTDGTEPTEHSTKYTEPICITETVTIKAKAFHELRSPSLTSSFSYTVLVPNSITVSLADYSHEIWGSGMKAIKSLEFNLNNQEQEQNTVILLAIYDNSKLLSTHIIKNKKIINGINTITFSDIDIKCNPLYKYQVRLFIWSADYDMYPLGKINKFSI